MFLGNFLKKNDNGFSLLELAVGVGIAAVVAAVGITATTVFVNNAADRAVSYESNADDAIAKAEASFDALWDGERPEPVVVVPKPSAPVLGSVSVSETTATVFWSASEGAEFYQILLNDNMVDSVGSETLTYTFSGLNDDTFYEYSINAVNDGGVTPSSVDSFTTERTIIKPSNVVNLLASNIEVDSASVSWGQPESGDPVESYVVYFNGTLYDTFNSNVFNVNFTGLDVGSEYSVTVESVNSAGSSSSTISFTTRNIIIATGGVVTTVTEGGTTYRVHSFRNTGSSTFNVTNAPPGAEIEYLIVAGGGAGGSGDDRTSGGGGGGGVLTGVRSISSGSWNVVVGAGGGVNSNGGNSSVFNLTALGGGHGGGRSPNGYFNGANGGSGGAGGHNPASSPGSGTAGQGFNGGNGYDSGNLSLMFASGGGGGAGGAGQTASSSTSGAAGRGGIGVLSSITGTALRYGGGGGGAAQIGGSASNYLNGQGGAGGGGAGARAQVSGSILANAQNGSPNTGGGGGGGASGAGALSGGNGGSGIVVIRYIISTE